MATNSISILIQAKDQASSVLSSVGRSLDDTSSHANGFSASLSRIKDVALGVYLPQLAGKLFDLGKSALESTGEFEQSRVAFETMLGSAKNAQDLMGQISQFAKETPFTLPEVVTDTKQLLAYGFAQEDLIPTMRKLGDLASGLGVPLNQVALAYGQVKVKGHLMGQETLQFTNAGIPLIQTLAKTMGKSTDEIYKMQDAGQIGFGDVETAIDSLTGKGSQFGGMMDKQSHTFNGVMSNMSDSFGQIGRAALGMDSSGNIIKGGFFDRIKGAAEALMPKLQDFANKVGPMVQVAMEKIGDVVSPVVEAIKYFAQQAGDYLGPKLSDLWTVVTTKLVPALQNFWHNVIEPMIPVIGTTLLLAIGLVVDSMTWWWQNVLTPFINFVAANKDWLLPIITALGLVKVALVMDSAFAALTGLFTTFTTLTIPSAVLAFDGLKASIGTPMIMPAIVIAAGLLAIAELVSAWKSAMDSITQAKSAGESLIKQDSALLDKYSAILKDPKASFTDKSNAQRAMNGIYADLKGNANGTNFWGGGVSLVGENGPELVNLPRGAQVTNTQKTQKILSGSGSSVTIQTLNVNNNVDVQQVVRSIGFALATR